MDYLKKNPTWHIEDSAWKAKQIIRILHNNQINPKSVCDVGCGAGEVLYQLYQQLSEDIMFYGHEISPQALEFCKERANDRLIFKHSDIFEEDDVFFDVIMAIDVIEHIEDYYGFLRRLRGKGRFKILHIPLDLTVRSILWRSLLLNSRENSGHIQYFTKDIALLTLKDAGFDVLDYFYTSKSLDLQPRTRKRLLAKVPRKALYMIDRDMAVRLFGGFSLLVLAK